MTGRQWWRDAIGYEVYVRSFADGDGDGVGDLPGISANLDHLRDLGVEVVWLTPCYPSPLLDGGYDVADYRSIAPELGTMEDLDALVAGVHERGMRLLLDLVPNHTSSEHEWFKAARSSRDDPHRDYYIWRDPAPDGGPPNNWVSHFGGSAWTYDEHTGQYWLHLFLPEQPDLNWRNPAVRREFEDILRFWFDRGVDGFRIDVAHSLVKHPDLPDQPPATGRVAAEDIDLGSAASIWETLEHPYDSDQEGVLDIYRRWRPLADGYGALLLGEVYVLEPDRFKRYLAGDGLHAAFWFRPLHAPWRAPALRAVLRAGAEVAVTQPGDVAWASGSHDRSRAVARFGGGDIGRARAFAFTTLAVFLPGMAFLYQGEELGLDDPVLAQADNRDPIAVRAGEYDRSRDVARTPMPWAAGPGFGFTTAERPWLPYGDRQPSDTADVQRDDPASPLSAHRALLALQRELRPQLEGTFEWLNLHSDVVAFRRGAVTVALNAGPDPVTVDLGSGTVRFSTLLRNPMPVEGLELDPAEAVVVA
jgi:alpha-glucosidase